MRIRRSRLPKFGMRRPLSPDTSHIAGPSTFPTFATKERLNPSSRAFNTGLSFGGPVCLFLEPNMGRSFRAARVLQTARNSIGRSGPQGMTISAPVWLQALERWPPAEILTRPKPVPHHDPNPRMRKPKNIYKPQRIAHPEDELRRTFFRDHPWELARPRMAVELDGKDAQYLDWSRGLQQPGMQVTGES